MAAVPREVVRQDRGYRMTNKTDNPLIPVTGKPGQDAPPPVRVKLRRVNANHAKNYPPDGETKAWWQAAEESPWHHLERLRQRLLVPTAGGRSIALRRGSRKSAVNAALAMIEAAAPKDEIEGALAVQMACTHSAVMAVLARLGGGGGSEQRVIALGSTAARLLRAYSTQVEVFRRLRHGGNQYVRVEHVHVNDGGQAVIGNVKPASSRARSIDHSSGD